MHTNKILIGSAIKIDLTSGSALKGGWLSFARPKESHERKGRPRFAAENCSLRYSIGPAVCATRAPYARSHVHQAGSISDTG